MNLPKLKICGIRFQNNLSKIFQLDPDFLGFIFYPPSKRYINPDEAWRIINNLPKQIDPVGVFVNSSTADILSITRKCKISTLQLHGDEPPSQCAELKTMGFRVIKAFRINSQFTWETLFPYTTAVDFFLFDSDGKFVGGNGVSFDWSILHSYPLNIPYFIAGGINLNNIYRLFSYKLPKLYALDVNSGFEIRPGEKDVKKLLQLIQFLHSLKNGGDRELS